MTGEKAVTVETLRAAMLAERFAAECVRTVEASGRRENVVAAAAERAKIVHHNALRDLEVALNAIAARLGE